MAVAVCGKRGGIGNDAGESSERGVGRRVGPGEGAVEGGGPSPGTVRNNLFVA